MVVEEVVVLLWVNVDVLVWMDVDVSLVVDVLVLCFETTSPA